MATHSADEVNVSPSEPAGTAAAKAEKKKRILASATRIFARKGFPAARVSDIARDAGVADGTVYLYFQGKDDLLLSIFQSSMDRYLEIAETIVGEVDDPAERIRRFAMLHLELLGADRDLAAVFQVELRGSRRSMSLLSRDRLSDYFELLAETIAAGQDRGQFRRELRPKMAARIFWGALDEVVTHWVLAEKPSDLVAAGSTAVEIVLRGISVGPEGA
jgi:TetR/AcrR family transcriptional regulator, fatty acid metabolism regulator protein